MNYFVQIRQGRFWQSVYKGTSRADCVAWKNEYLSQMGPAHIDYARKSVRVVSRRSE